jgi:hypothetical protein
MPIVLAIQKAKIRRITVQRKPRQIDLILKKLNTKKGLVEWLKM